MEKAGLRSRILEMRDSIPQSDVEGLSAKICADVLLLPEIMAASSVAIYISLGKEVQAEMLFDNLLSMGKKIFLPVVSGGEMKLVRAKSLHGLVAGKFANLEPNGKIPKKGGDAQVYLIPGVAFDSLGFRIGYGKGFFDRFLAGRKKAFKVGLAYDLQIVDSFPTEPHDVRMDAVITEKRTLRF